MTNEEAIEWLNGISHSFGTLEEAEEDQRFRKVTIEALEKQIQKKVTRNKVYSRIRFCPECGMPFEVERNYCDECGQRLMWEDERNETD